MQESEETIDDIGEMHTRELALHVLSILAPFLPLEETLFSPHSPMRS